MFMKRSGFNSLKDALTKLENAFCNSRSFVRRVITIVSLHVTCQLCSWVLWQSFPPQFGDSLGCHHTTKSTLNRRRSQNSREKTSKIHPRFCVSCMMVYFCTAVVHSDNKLMVMRENESKSDRTFWLYPVAFEWRVIAPQSRFPSVN